MKYFIFFAITLFTIHVFSQKNIVINSKNENNLSIISSSKEDIKISFTIKDLLANTIKTPDGVFSTLNLNDAINSGETGSPSLPMISKIIRIPEGAEIDIVFQTKEYIDIELNDYNITSHLYPTQEHITKDSEQKPAFRYNQAIYNKDEFFGMDLVNLEIKGNMRNMRIALLKICPIQYNPVKNILRVYHRINFSLVYKNADWQKTSDLDTKYSSFLFSSIENKLMNNEAFNNTKDTLTQYPVKYVIIADTMFHDALQPFIEWKSKKGFIVVEAYTSNPSVGTTTTSIQSYLQNIYDNASPTDPAQSFVLLVGDVAQIPSFSGIAGSHYSDMYYAEYTSDNIPEVFIGRFSANSVAQLQAQIDKTLEYEQYLFPEENWLDTVVMIAGADGTYGPTHGNGQINYGTTYYFNPAQGLYSYTHLYPNSSSEATQIRAEIGQGVSFANYTAHGSTSGWADPSFSSTDVASMNNNHKYPLMIGNACSTNTFSSDCFGEILLRAVDKGAIGYIGGSNSTYWDEDFYWAVGVRSTIDANPSYDTNHLGAYDRLWHISGETFSEWFVSQGQMLMAGNIAVLESGSSSYTYYSEIYHLMGDPSLMIYLGVPSQLSVNHPALIPIGQNTISISTEPHAYIGLSQNGVWHGAGIADASGNLNLSIIPFTIPGNVDIVGTKQFRKPYISTIIAQNPTGPYVLFDSNSISDSSANNNQMADYSETVNLNVRLKNYGLQDDSTIYAVLSTSDSYINIIDSVGIWGLINADDTLTLAQAFTIKIDTLIPDQHIVSFDLSIRDSSANIWSSTFSIFLNAPLLEVMDLSIDDSGTGNGNNKLDAGETVDIYISVINNGHSDINQAMADLISSSPYITINSSQVNHDTLFQMLMETGQYNITVDGATPIGTSVDFTLDLVAGLYSDNKTFIKSVGQIDEDWETGDLNQYAWISGGDVPWSITSGNPYEGSFAAISGDIGDDQTSTLSIMVNVLSSDTLSFYKKVSCEEEWYGVLWDYLDFQIDGNSQDKWAGEVAWSKEEYNISIGNHTFSWIYSKDGSISSGADAAWLDYIIFPPMLVISGIDNLSVRSDEINLYPNPAIDITTLSFYHSGGTFLIQVFDINGKLVFDASNNAAEGVIYYPINLSSWKQGVYTLSINSNKQYFSSSIIKI